jgi:hypothetical protein
MSKHPGTDHGGQLRHLRSELGDTSVRVSQSRQRSSIRVSRNSTSRTLAIWEYAVPSDAR